VVRQQAGGSPAATHFLLLRQKKVSKEKATLLSASPFAYATGATCGARSSRGRARTRCAQTIARPDPPGPPLLGAARRVVGSGAGSDSGSQSGSDEDAQSASSPPRIGIGIGIGIGISPNPSGWAEERRQKRIRASDCLSRRRVRARPRFCRAPQVAPKRSAGDPDHRVAFFLGTFLWRRKEKCLARRGETRLARRPTAAQAGTGFGKPSPNGEGFSVQGTPRSPVHPPAPDPGCPVPAPSRHRAR